MIRLAILASHPVQYYTPLFRKLAEHLELTVFYAHQASPLDQARAGFGVGFDWDVDLLSGYKHAFLKNVARRPGLDRFAGVDTPEIGERLRAGAFDALMLMGWHYKTFLQGLIAAKRIGLPVLVRGDSHLDTQRSAVKRAAKQMLYPLFLRQFNAALFVGERNRAYWEHYGYPTGRMFHAPHCVDNAWFAERASLQAREQFRQDHGIPQDAKVALFAGKLVPFKRPMDVVEALARVSNSADPLRLLIAGAGELDDSIQARARELGIQVHGLGFCNQSEMPRAYSASDVLVLPSSSETWGLVVNEALACGRPVIVSDAVGCSPDLQRLLGAGTVYPVGDVAALADRIAALLARPPEPAALAGAAANFSLQNAALGILTAASAVSGR